MIKLIERAYNNKNRIAVKSEGYSYTYKTLLNKSESIAVELLAGKRDLNEQRITFLVNPSFQYVTIQWGIWRAGGIAVPLCIKHPLESIKYVLEDTDASILIYSKEYKDLIEPLFNNTNIRFIRAESFSNIFGLLPEVDIKRRAMIIYTSGTTGLPKGVVSTHKNIEAQISSLISFWGWNQSDHILNVLPMHHVHGIINVLSCALWSGACCEFLPKFNPEEIFKLFKKQEINVFMAVPTIYFKLIAYWNDLKKTEQEEIFLILKKFRLMVSGSAALPLSLHEQWEKISNHVLLERYGMTEMGMAISNPYNGKRRPGFIGQPLGNVSVRLVDENNNLVKVGEPGEIQVKGENVFNEYWNKPEATKEAFTLDGWFKTGDIAVLNNGSYKILGRNSVDIIKSGGYKISALEIEEVLRQHVNIKDCAVIGIPDEEWGEIIGVSLVLNTKEISIDNLKSWLIEKLPGYKIPKKYIIQTDLPRNTMGKVTKNELKKLFSVNIL
ncbi:acyl-CoA synthetase [Mariniflexile jejuense]|uniref:Acyl-CoA synthetase n=1 Tax=Mariniflexile jejuense TaxID=1173582 RepID=A0ABW3JLC5_9FLAO